MHIQGVRNIVKKHRESPFHILVHNTEKHEGRNRDGVEMKITGVYGGDATKRQVTEAVQIQHNVRGGLIREHPHIR